MNDAATGTASFPKDGSAATTTASQTAATIAYDLATRGYTITIGSRSQTFLPADIDAAQSNAGVTVYIKRNGTTTDSLTLTKPGTFGRFNYEFVGGGYWQRTIDGATTISGSLDAFAYGLQTPNTAIPRTGRAEYSIDVLGAQTVVNNVLGFTGTGTAQVDFLNGDITMRGTLTGTRFGTAGFSGGARLSSSANSFSGSFGFFDGGQFLFSGPMDGRFYGPASQEIGAAFSTRSNDGHVAVGTVIGRGSTVNSNIRSFNQADVNSDSAKIKFDFDSAAGTFANSSSAQAPMIVQFDSAANSYTLVQSDRGEIFGPSRLVEFARVRDQLAEVRTSLTLSHVQTQKWTRTLERGASDPLDINYFAFGTFTPEAAMPRTGEAGYEVGLAGTAIDPDFNTFFNFNGRGSLLANFATGGLTVTGRTFFEVPTGTPTTGEFNGTATISTSARSFSGTMTMTGIGSYSGTLGGHFYGPAAEELGGAFNLTDGDRGVAAGVLVGKVDPTLTAAGVGLLDLTAPTTFESKYLFGATGQGFQSRDGSTLAFDPATRTYTFTTREGDGPVGSPFVFGPSQIDSAKTNAERTVYGFTRTGPDITYSASVFNPGPTNTTLALTYTSFADIRVTESPGGRFSHYYHPFGIRTPSSQMPLTGTASYRGQVFGEGVNFAAGGRRDFTLNGTSSLDVDFARGSFVSALNISGTNILTNAIEAFPTFNSNGDVFRNPANIGGNSDNGFAGFFSNASGRFEGKFYGAGAAEFGGIFSFDYRLPDNTTLQLNGVTLGKRGN